MKREYVIMKEDVSCFMQHQNMDAVVVSAYSRPASLVILFFAKVSNITLPSLFQYHLAHINRT